MSDTEPKPSLDFIRSMIEADLASGKHAGIVTRFPPEPNGYLHIGHAKSLCLNFGVAEEFGGVCNLRFDDTNPTREEQEYIDAIKADVRWLGFDWGDRLFHASDYFERLYGYAVDLIRMGKAYVCELSADEMREYRGTLTEPGRNSPWRDRPIEESLDLFTRMRAGEFEDGSRVLRAKVDMASPNIIMRDPVIYRILTASHPRTGDEWCIYPMYDFTHCLSDSMECITHSLCTLEFDNNRAIYDWIIDSLETDSRPEQTEFARMNLTHTVLSKRMLVTLVRDGHVDGWDDPRMPTLVGLRRRGYTSAAIRTFLGKVGVAKSETTSEIELLEHCLREDLNRHSPRAMAVLHPLKVVIENLPEGETDELTAVNNPEDPDAGARKVPFSREIWIERDDFMEEPVRKFFRLAPGREVRLRYGYFITCREAVKDPDTGEVVELRCTYDPETRGGSAPDGRKVKATLHWVSAAHALDAEVRLFHHLFTSAFPTETDGGKDFTSNLSPDSREVLTGCKVEPSLAGAEAGNRYQFERLGYFCLDRDSSEEHLVFNRTVTLKDTWAKIQKGRQKQQGKKGQKGQKGQKRKKG